MKPIIVLMLFILTGCGATGPIYQEPPPPPAGYATLIIYRFSNGYGGAYPIDISINASEKAASVDEQGYTVIWVIADGQQHTIRDGPTNKSSTDTVSIKPKPGETIFVKYIADAPSGSLSAGGIASIFRREANPFRVVAPDQGQKEILEYKLQPAKVQAIQ